MRASGQNDAIKELAPGVHAVIEKIRSMMDDRAYGSITIEFRDGRLDFIAERRTTKIRAAKLDH